MNDKYQVMMQWEQKYMESCIDQLKPKGDVLEIGFGLGYSATQIQKYKPKSHTIIEMDSMIVQKAKEWAKNYDTTINIVEGTWQKELHNLGTFDEIFFDDYPLNPETNNPMEQKTMKDRLFMFIDICLDWHTNQNAKFSAYIHDPSNTFQQRMEQNQRIHYHQTVIEVDVPDNCKYFNRDVGGVIPIITKR